MKPESFEKAMQISFVRSSIVANFWKTSFEEMPTFDDLQKSTTQILQTPKHKKFKYKYCKRDGKRAPKWSQKGL